MGRERRGTERERDREIERACRQNKHTTKGRKN